MSENDSTNQAPNITDQGVAEIKGETLFMKKRHNNPQPAPTQAAAPAVEEKPVETTEVVEQASEVVTETAVEETGVQTAPPEVIETAVEVQAAPEVTETVKQEDPVAQVQETATSGESDFTKAIENLKKTGTSNQRALINSLEMYIERMAPGMPVDNDQGARNQYMLWKTIVNISTNAPINEFKSLWSLLLAYFKEFETGVFHERYIFRFSEFWVQPDAELHGLQRVLNLIKLTCNPATREQGMKQVDLHRTLADGFSEDARSRIVNFYN